MIKEFPLHEVFDFIRGNSKYTKEYGRNNKGNYPVFSASMLSPLTYISTYDFDGEYLSYTMNGYGGYIFILEGSFSINADRGLLVPKNHNIDLNYARFILQPFFRELALGRVVDGKKNEFTKINPQIIKNICFPIPICSDGSFDLEKQVKIAQKYKKLESLKKVLEEHLNKIEKTLIEPDKNETKTTEVSLCNNSLFSLEQNKLGLNQNDYRKLDTKNSESIPVFSAKNHPIAYFDTLKDRFLFEASNKEPLISFADDGDGSAGTNLIFHEKPFYNNTSRKILRIINPQIDPKYVFFSLLDMKRIYGFDHKYKCNTENLSKVIITLPVNDNGLFDIKEQKRISQEYEKIEKIKKNVSISLRKILDMNVKVSIRDLE